MPLETTLTMILPTSTPTQLAALASFLLFGAAAEGSGPNEAFTKSVASDRLAPAAHAVGELDSVPNEHIERRLSAMGTWLDISLEASDRASGLLASEAAVLAIELVEARLSSWRADSELSRLNAAATGELMPLSPQLRADLATVQHYWRQTRGAFDPSIGSLVAAYDLRQNGHWPSPLQLSQARVPAGFAALEITSAGATRKHPALQLDAGSFGKGLGLDAAIAALRECGTQQARIDLGGQVSIIGAAVDLPLADPFDRNAPLLTLRLEAGSCATSGNSTRALHVAGKQLGHILDPRSGRPVRNFGSLTVLAPTATQADCLSTALYVMGPAAALAFAARHKEIEVLILEAGEQGLRASASIGLAGGALSFSKPIPLFIDEQQSASAQLHQ